MAIQLVFCTQLARGRFTPGEGNRRPPGHTVVAALRRSLRPDAVSGLFSLLPTLRACAAASMVTP